MNDNQDTCKHGIISDVKAGFGEVYNRSILRRHYEFRGFFFAIFLLSTLLYSVLTHNYSLTRIHFRSRGLGPGRTYFDANHSAGLKWV